MILEAAGIVFVCTLTIAVQPLPEGVTNKLITPTSQTLIYESSDVEEKKKKEEFKTKVEERTKELQPAPHDVSSNSTSTDVDVVSWLNKFLGYNNTNITGNESLPKTNEGKDPSNSEKVNVNMKTVLTSSETIDSKSMTNKTTVDLPRPVSSCHLNSDGSVCTYVLIFSATVYFQHIYQSLNEISYFY